jgi:polysaccharide pyruvyl transferase WcaK-like protein
MVLVNHVKDLTAGIRLTRILRRQVSNAKSNIVKSQNELKSSYDVIIIGGGDFYTNADSRGKIKEKNELIISGSSYY